ncbi:MFS transporter [Nonomuraea salmonea]|uniref:MFS transporter n=1 Tax=Nonomuraea salmonea TaxID=46181 RepID=UPI002FE836EB
MIVIGLGTVWILDGLEVTIVGNLSAQLAKPGSGLDITQAQVAGVAAALYVAGACAGALFFGWLTDKFGRKKLFIITLVVYLVATLLTAFSFSAWWFFLFRFMTGFGIGGEYAAINSAIDELIPSRHRGRIDIIINGSYWLGAAGALLTVPLLNDLPVNIGWRVAFGLGVVLGLAILLVRRNVPESPRWLFIHGRDREAEQLVDEVERQIGRDDLPEPEKSMTIHQRKSIGFVRIAHTMVALYPKRTVLGLSLFIGQAFLYNAITFGYAQILSTFFNIDTHTGYYFAVIAVGNFLGPLLLGHLFDTVGRVPMISATYIGSGVLLLGTAWLFNQGVLTAVTLTACWSVVLFVASAGGEFGVSDGERDLPHGDQGDGHRVLLRHRHGGRWHRRSAGVRHAGGERGAGGHGAGVHHRRAGDDRGRARGAVPGRQGRTQGAGGHRGAALRRRGDQGHLTVVSSFPVK